MMKSDISAAAWRKSSRSGTTGNCVEVGDLPGLVAVRDTKDPHGPALAFAPTAWAAFTAKLKNSAPGHR